jgi:hypothetical protein
MLEASVGAVVSRPQDLCGERACGAPFQPHFVIATVIVATAGRDRRPR